MAQTSHIEWTDATWNPVTGCTKVSPGCTHCYAERMAHRLQAMGQRRYSNGFQLTLHHDLLTQPLRWKKPRNIFVNSMSDLFHEAVPLDFLRAIFEVIAAARRHNFQVLTKRSARLCELRSKLEWPDNLFVGVSVESKRYLFRIDELRQVPAAVRFVSAEPLLEDLSTMKLNGIDWVIVGGESGPRARPMEATWVREIRDNCLREGVAFFFKQWGGVWKSRSGRVLDGRTWDEIPLPVSKPLRHPGRSHMST